MKTRHLILGVVITLIISCGALFFLTTKSHADKTPTPISEIHTMEAFNKSQDEALVENINTKPIREKQPNIEHTFGFKVGGAFETTSAIGTLETSSGDTLYEVEPSEPYDLLMKYYVTTDEETNKIDSIRGMNTFSSLEVAKASINRLENIIENQYSKLQTQDDFKYYKDQKGNLILLFLKPVNGEYELHLHCLCLA